MWAPPLRNEPYANGWNAFSRNSLSLSPYLHCRLTTISLSAVFARWLLLAKSAEEPVVPKAVPLAWDWPPSSAPGWPSISILFSNVWPFSLPHPPWVNSEQLQRVLTLDYSSETEVY